MCKSMNPYNVVIFDLGDVLFTWSHSPKRSPLSAELLRRILSSVHWFDYEKGNLDEDTVHSLVAEEFGLSFDDVKSTLQAARDTLQKNPRMLEIIRELKEAGMTVYAMSNISAPDWTVLSTKATPEDWAPFTRVFTSALIGERKPNIGFYKRVIEESGIDPSRAIFVDDKLENVLTARSFGMYGIVFDDQSKVIKELKNMCYDPVIRGKEYLSSRKKKFTSVTSNNIEFSDNFSQFLILEVTDDRSLVDYKNHLGQCNFFQGGPILTTDSFPNDLDTTAIALTTCDHVDLDTKHEVMNDMLNYRSSDGITQVYFDHSRPRMDPIVCTNVLTLFYGNGRGHELSATLKWVEQVLINRAYISGTYYYVGGDLFLFFLSRLLRTSKEVLRQLGPAFKERVIERFGQETDSLGLATRILAALAVGIVDDRDLQTLIIMQCEDGSWKDGWFYKYGSTGIQIRNDGVTTAMAIRAIQQARIRRNIQVERTTEVKEKLERSDQ